MSSSPHEPAHGSESEASTTTNPSEPSVSTNDTRPSKKRRPILRFLGLALMFVVIAIAVVVWQLRARLVGGLPPIDGVIAVDPGSVRASITITRDALGIPTIVAQDRNDLAFGLGFVHAQDRYFQMDLIRRGAAGELAALLGPIPSVIDRDRTIRLHRFRDVARRAIADYDAEDRRYLEAYVAGVNAGLASIETKPFAYQVLGGEPEPWTLEDCLLVGAAMHLDLNDYAGYEALFGAVAEALPTELVAFLTPRGTLAWDDPLIGDPIPENPIPGPDVIDLRADVMRQTVAEPSDEPEGRTGWLGPNEPDELVRGSNSWVVSGAHTEHGAALVANDMHLGLSVPCIWYRVALDWPDPRGEGPDDRLLAAGLTIPGGPAMIAGSNGHIAWALTNSGGDWADLVVLDDDASDPIVEIAEEVIEVRDGSEIRIDIEITRFGPIYDRDGSGRPRALRWLAHDPGAHNLDLARMVEVLDVDEALDLAPLCGTPPLNVLVGDRDGQIGWTIMGRIPRRVGRTADGRFPATAEHAGTWEGFLEPEEYPRIVDPPEGFLWTANQRLVDRDDLDKLGIGRYDPGCRGGMIHKRLEAQDVFDEADMLAIQLDDHAVFWERWRDLLISTREGNATEDPQYEALLEAVESGWSGRATPDAVGFRIVWEFRNRTIRAAVEPLVRAALERDPSLTYAHLPLEGPAWTLVTERPEHLLAPGYDSWNDLLTAQVEAIRADIASRGTTIDNYNWGERNNFVLQHPLSLAVPPLSKAFAVIGAPLDMPAIPCNGATSHMPRIYGSGFGASERFAVAPGHEDKGYMHIPGGQSEHPFSDYYSAGFEDWAYGKASPFLPGKPVATLQLVPEPES